LRERRSLALDAIALEAVQRFGRILARCGYDSEEAQRAFKKAMASARTECVADAGNAERELTDAAHILTMWYSHPEYVGSSGTPRALPERGGRPSLETLVREVNPRWSFEDVRSYLVRTRAIKRTGKTYLPRQRNLSLRGTRGPTHFRNLRGLLGMLRTMEHNLEPRRRTPSWYEYLAENPRFPVAALPAFDARLKQILDRVLTEVDSEMLREELRRSPGDETVELGIGIYRFEHAAPPKRTRRVRR
jgi:hypothetical protein